MADQKTKAPALIMENYFFSDIQVRSNLNLQQEDLDSCKAFEYGFVNKLDILSNNDDTSLFLVILKISNEAHDGPKAHEIAVTVHGVFKLPADLDDNEKQKLLRVLAPSMLYGSAREFILTITARGPYPPVYLPTTSFVPAPPEELVNE